MCHNVFHNKNRNRPSHDEIKNVKVDLVFDPPWTKAMMSDAAKLELGLL